MTHKTLIHILKIGLVTTAVLILMNYSNSFASQFPWIGENEYRILVNTMESSSEYSTLPISFILKDDQIKERLSLNLDKIELASIRVVKYDNKNKPVIYSKDVLKEKYYIPTRLNYDEHTSELKISWRVNINDANTFAIYFSRKGCELDKPLDEIPIIGDGDYLSYGQRNIKAPISGGYNQSIDAVDFDKDGDTDLFVGFCGVPYKKGLFYYENIGSQNDPLLILRKKIFDINKNFQLIDWDKDGQFEIIYGGEIFNIENSSNEPIISLFGELPKSSSVKDIFIDWDGDNVDDLLSVSQITPRRDPSSSFWDPSLPPYTVLGIWMGTDARNTIVFHKNIGTNLNHVYNKSKQLNAGGIPIEIFGSLNISAGDMDGDGDNDLIIGNRFQIISFRNEGTSISPKLAKGQIIKTLDNQNPFSIYTKPRLADWDSDGKLDILLGNEDGRPTWIKNLGDYKFDIERFLIQLDPNIDFGCLSVPVVCDWDSDGDYDLLAGNSSGFVEYIENISSSPTKFIFKKSNRMIADNKEIRVLAYNSGSIQGPKEAKYGYTMPEVADWDGDGDLDLLLSDIKGEHNYYNNIGTKNKPILAKAEPLKVAWKKIPPKPSFNWRQPEATELVTVPRCRPAVIDWNSDGLLDYVALDHEGYLAYYEAYIKNDEKWLKQGLRCFKQQDGTPIRISKFVGAHSGRARIAFADWDGDGDLDIIHNAHRLFDDTPALLKKVKHAGWFENRGGEGEPKYVWQGEIIKKDFPLTSEHSTSPEVVDLDGDGKLDLFLGGEDGRITCFHRAFIENDLPVLRLMQMEKRKN